MWGYRPPHKQLTVNLLFHQKGWIIQFQTIFKLYIFFPISYLYPPSFCYFLYAFLWSDNVPPTVVSKGMIWFFSLGQHVGYLGCFFLENWWNMRFWYKNSMDNCVNPERIVSVSKQNCGCSYFDSLWNVPWIFDQEGGVPRHIVWSVWAVPSATNRLLHLRWTKVTQLFLSAP